MRTKPHDLLEKGRCQVPPYLSPPGAMYGAFVVRSPEGGYLRIIATPGEPGLAPWEHVSVSREDRLPTWGEMCWIKSLFWDPAECVVQFHPPKSEYVNHHPLCLHLWKPIDVVIPTPPTWMIGPTKGGA